MAAWVYIAIAAAAFQTVRFMVQKRLSMDVLSSGGATFARFIYSAPFITTLAAAYWLSQGGEPLGVTAKFWANALTGGLAQILGTWCVVALFQLRNFAVGVTFKKTEVVQTAILGFLLLGDKVSLPGMVAIFLGLAGVLALSAPPEPGGKFFNRAAGVGLLSGAFFAVSAVNYRAATLVITSEDPVLRGAVTLAFVTVAQALAMAFWLRWREPGEIGRVLGVWSQAVWVGIAGMAGSLCWFIAFTLQNAAYVKAVGQIEVIFSIVASVLFFRERITQRELLGIALLTASILGMVLWAK